MVSNDCSRVGVNVILVTGGIRKPVCSDIFTDIFQKAGNSIQCAFPGADDQETQVCY